MPIYRCTRPSCRSQRAPTTACGVNALRVALLALEVPQHQVLDVRAHLILRDAPILHVDRVLPVEIAAPVGPQRTRGVSVLGTGGRSRAKAHLQSKMHSIVSSFQSSGMRTRDKEAALHWAHDRLLGALMCWPFRMHDARSQCLLGNVPLRALPRPQFRQTISGRVGS